MPARKRKWNRVMTYMGTCQGCHERLLLKSNLCETCYFMWDCLPNPGSAHAPLLHGREDAEREARIAKYEALAGQKKPLFD